MVFHWRLSESMSSQISRTLLSILVVLNNVVVWMVSTRPLISTSSSPFNYLLLNVPKVFFNSLARSRYLSFLSHFFNFTLWSAGKAKSTNLQVLFFFFVNYYEVWSSGRDLVIRLYLKKSLRNLRVSFSRTDVGFCIYHLFVWSNYNFLRSSQWIIIIIIIIV